MCTCCRLELEAACQSRSHWWWTLNTTRLSLHLPRLQQHNITAVAVCVHVVCWNHCRQFAGVIIEQFVGPLLNRINPGVIMLNLWNRINLWETMVFLWNRTIIGVIMIFYVSSLMVLYSYDICVLCMLPYFVDKHMQRPYVFLRLLFLFEPERYFRVRLFINILWQH